MLNVRAQERRNQDPKDPILYPFNWQKFLKSLPISSVGKNGEQLEGLYTAAGSLTITGTTTSENNLTISTKVEHLLT